MNITSNITSETDVQTESYFTHFLYAYGVPAICIFGIVGNIFSFHVFVFKSFRSHSSSAYIAALSISDSCFLLSLFFSWLGNGNFGFLLSKSTVWCHLMIFTTSVCSFLSVWYVVLIMVDRIVLYRWGFPIIAHESSVIMGFKGKAYGYIQRRSSTPARLEVDRYFILIGQLVVRFGYLVVCHPLRVPELCTKRRATMATLGVTTFSIIFNSHFFVTAEVHGDHCYIQEKSSMLHVLTIFIYIDTALTFIVPFAFISLLNIVVIFCIKRFHTRHVQQRTSNLIRNNTVSKAQMRITRTFTLVSIVLLITNVPSHGIRFYIMINNLYQGQDSVLVNAQQIFQIIYYMNFAVNFLLYSASNEKFRRYFSYKYVCRNLYRRRRHAENDHLYR